VPRNWGADHLIPLPSSLRLEPQYDSLGTTVLTGVPRKPSGSKLFRRNEPSFPDRTSYEVVIGGTRGDNNALTNVYNPYVQTVMARALPSLC